MKTNHAAQTTQTAEVLNERFDTVPIGHLVESKHNPRKHFDAGKLDELAASIRERGIVEPLVVRPNGKDDRYEIVAGARRFRAAQLAGLERVPAVIRSYADADVLELMLIENLQRDDLTPLERAAGFRALIDSKPDKHSAQSIATRVGKSVAWVWDQLKLIDLVPAAKALLEADRMSVGHAVLIARLKADDQLRVINVDERRGHGAELGGLWESDTAPLPIDPARKPGKYDELKPRSIRELEKWIADHIRFDVKHAAQAMPLQYEAVAARVDQALEKPGRARKVIAITFASFTQPEARDDEERTYGPSSWKRADGTKKSTVIGWPSRRLVDSPTCEYAVLGVVATGAGRGDAFDVCIARDKCRTHWKKEIEAREKAAKSKASTKPSSAKATREQAARDRDVKKQQAAEARWAKFLPLLIKAVRVKVDALPVTLPAPLLRKTLEAHHLPPTLKPAGIAKALLEKTVRMEFSTYAWHGNEGKLVAWAKLLGVDVKAIEPALPGGFVDAVRKAAKKAATK